MSRDDDMDLLHELKAVNDASGEFAAGVLEGSLTREDQVSFARQLVRLAQQISDRAACTTGVVVEGAVIDPRDRNR